VVGSTQLGCTVRFHEGRHSGCRGCRLPDREAAPRRAKNVAVIERDQKTAKHASNYLDCLVIQGEGNNIDVLRNAGVDGADFFIGFTNSDEADMISCGLVAFILRDSSYIIPSGDTVIRDNDAVYIVAEEKNLETLFMKTGKHRINLNRIVIAFFMLIPFFLSLFTTKRGKRHRVFLLSSSRSLSCPQPYFYSPGKASARPCPPGREKGHENRHAAQAGEVYTIVILFALMFWKK
jgi:hypothetical protein